MNCDAILLYRMEQQGEVSVGGYDYQFVETPPDILICKICYFTSREPCLSECCGHTFCKSCIDHAQKATVFYPYLCPVCRSEEFKLIQNKQNARIIKDLFVFCSNKERGCEWEGELNTINQHLEGNGGCPYEDVACPNKCDKFVQRKCLNDHLENECPRRKVNCQYCQITDELQYIEGIHMERCLRLPLPCPNDCGVCEIPREDVDDHREVCPLEQVVCPYKCEGFLQRHSLQNHIENECPRRIVSCQYCQFIGEQQFINGQHTELCPKFPLTCPNKCEVDILREDMESHKKKCPLEMVKCRYQSVGCKTVIARKDLMKHNQEKMEEHLAYSMDELLSTRDKLATARQQLITYTQQASAAQTNLLDKLNAVELQSQQSNSVLQERIRKMQVQMKWSFSIGSRPRYYKNDHIFPVVIRVSEFASKRSDAEDWFSRCFFTHGRGYKIQLNVIPAGWDNCEGSCLSVFLFLVRGPYDHKLQWPMRKTIQVKLLNQLSDQYHCSHHYTTNANRCFGDASRIIWEYPRFISNDMLYGATTTHCQFLFNDSICFEVDEV